MKIIDAHCHIFPDKIAKYATEKIQEFYNIPKTTYYGTASELVQQCNESGVDKCIVSMLATTPIKPHKLNEHLLELTKIFPEKLIPLASLHPQSETLEDDFNHLMGFGFKGVKLHPDMQGCKADCDGYKKIYDLCAQNHLPILLHTGDSRYDNSNPDRIEKILKEFPDLVVIGAHFGGWSVWEEATEKLYKYENFYVDTCSSTCLLPDTSIKKMINKYGTDKVIFGTDYPIWKQTDEINKLISLDLSTDALEKIFYKNIEMVLNIC